MWRPSAASTSDAAAGAITSTRISYEGQAKLAAKKAILRETLERVGKLKELAEIEVIAGERPGDTGTGRSFMFRMASLGT